METIAARTGQGISGGVSGAVGQVRQQGLEFGAPYTIGQVARAGIKGGLAGAVGGLAQGASHAGAQALRKLGAGQISGDVQKMGTHFASEMQEVARMEGVRTMQGSVDRTLAGNATSVIVKMATMPVPQEQRGEFSERGSLLLGLVRQAGESGNYDNISGHPYFAKVPARDRESFARAVASTVGNYSANPDMLANISYNLHRMGGLTNENMREFLRNYKYERSSYNENKSETHGKYNG